MDLLLKPIHPGEILLEEFLKPLKISQYRLAKDISVPARRINEIVLGKRSISADTALRLSKYFGLSDPYWLKIQIQFDLDVEKIRLQNRLETEVKVYAMKPSESGQLAIREGGEGDFKVIA